MCALRKEGDTVQEMASTVSGTWQCKQRFCPFLCLGCCSLHSIWITSLNPHKTIFNQVKWEGLAKVTWLMGAGVGISPWEPGGYLTVLQRLCGGEVAKGLGMCSQKGNPIWLLVLREGLESFPDCKAQNTLCPTHLSVILWGKKSWAFGELLAGGRHSLSLGYKDVKENT